MKKKKNKSADPLKDLIVRADNPTLGKLIFQLAATQPDMKRQCLEFLKKHVAPADTAGTETEIIFALWNELEPDLSELDEYGGGDYAVEDQVGELLYELASKLKKVKISKEGRGQLLDEVFSYIKSDNAGMTDSLGEVAYASCHDSDDWRNLAKRFESLGTEGSIDHARDLYRKQGDPKKYLALLTCSSTRPRTG